MLCQERAAADLPFVDAVGDWRAGELRVQVHREPVRCTAYRPDIGDVLPVYVADDYEGFRATPLPELDHDEVERYVAANVAAVREVAARARPSAALANHLVLGPAILARAIGGSVPYAVKVHGSALEYTVRPHRERFLALRARGAARSARGVLVGSRHTAQSLWEVVDEPGRAGAHAAGPARESRWSPSDRATSQDAAERLRALADRLERAGTAAWGGEPGARGGAAGPRPGPRAGRGVRGEADRVEGSGPAAGGVAAGGGRRTLGAPVRGRVRDLSPGARAPHRVALGGRHRGRARGRRPGSGARRAARGGSCVTWRPFSGA